MEQRPIQNFDQIVLVLVLDLYRFIQIYTDLYLKLMNKRAQATHTGTAPARATAE
jgi:hypothetical protein